MTIPPRHDRRFLWIAFPSGKKESARPRFATRTPFAAGRAVPALILVLAALFAFRAPAQEADGDPVPRLEAEEPADGQPEGKRYPDLADLQAAMAAVAARFPDLKDAADITDFYVADQYVKKWTYTDEDGNDREYYQDVTRGTGASSKYNEATKKGEITFPPGSGGMSRQQLENFIAHELQHIKDLKANPKIDTDITELNAFKRETENRLATNSPLRNAIYLDDDGTYKRTDMTKMENGVRVPDEDTIRKYLNTPRQGGLYTPIVPDALKGKNNITPEDGVIPVNKRLHRTA